MEKECHMHDGVGGALTHDREKLEGKEFNFPCRPESRPQKLLGINNAIVWP
jgi:hypothetical protein